MAYKNLLLHVHAEDPSRIVLETGKHLAETHQARITLVDVVPDPTWLTRLFDKKADDALAKAIQSKEAHLRELATQLGDIPTESRVLHGPTSLALIRDVLEHGHSLVVRETKGKSSPRSTFFGTTAFRLLRQCPCPVLLLKPNHAWPFERVAAAVDASNPDEAHVKLNKEILSMAVPFAAGDLHNLHVISAWTMYGESVLRDHMREGEFEDVMGTVKANSDRTLDDLVKEFGMGIGWENVHLFHGEPHRVLTNYVKETQIDLLVMGSVARAGVSGALMGNTAEQILNSIECSVMVLKPAGFKSPAAAAPHA